MKPSGNLVCKIRDVKLMTGFGKYHVAWPGGYVRLESFAEARKLFQSKVKEAP